VNKVLIIAAHPDDEALGCSGTIAKHAEEGDKVHLLFICDGVSSRSNSSDNDVEKRKLAAKKSANFLGAESIEFFDFPDNKLDTVPLLKVVQCIEKVIERFRPLVIYTHHIGDLNIDHQITHKAVMTACRPKPDFCVKEIYTFEVLSSTEWQTPGVLQFTPNVFVDIGQHINIKQKSLKAYREEMLQPPHTRNIDNVLRLNALRGNSIGVEYAEAFQLVRMLR